MRRALVLVGLAACRFGFAERADATDGRDNGGDTASDTPGDGSTAALCGTTSLLADDFSAAAAGPQWYPYTNAGGTVTQSGGDLVVTLQPTQSVGYSGYESSWKYDVRNSRVFVEVLQTTSTATHAQTDLQIVGGNETFQVVEEFGTLSAEKFVGNTQTTLGSTSYVAAQHRWWQLRESAGTLYFETSPDGVTYTQLASAPTPSWASTVDVALEAGAYQTEMNAGSARFAQLDGGTPSGAWCKASTQRDNFNTGTIGRDWASSYMTNGCTYAEAGGDVSFMLASNATQDCALVSASGFDLTGDAVFTALTTAPAANGNIFTFLRASNAAGDNVEVALIGSAIVSAQNTGGTFLQLSTTPYNPAAHQYWQLAESGGILSWQVSPDGATWTTLHAQAPPFSLVGVNLSIGAGTTASVANPGSAVFSTFDQLPP